MGAWKFRASIFCLTDYLNVQETKETNTYLRLNAALMVPSFVTDVVHSCKHRFECRIWAD